MRKFTIPAAALGVLTLAAMGASNPASAAPGAAFKGAAHAQTAPPDESDGTETADLPEAPEPAEVPEELPDQEDSEVAATADPESAPPDESDGTETADLPEAPEPAEVPEELPDQEDSEAAGPAKPDVDREVAKPAEPGWRDRTAPGNIFHRVLLGERDDRGDNNGAEGAGTRQSTSGGAASATGDLPATGGNASSTALIGGFALVAGGVMYRVGTRRQRA